MLIISNHIFARHTYIAQCYTYINDHDLVEINFYLIIFGKVIETTVMKTMDSYEQLQANIFSRENNVIIENIKQVKSDVLLGMIKRII